jgi:ATP-binding protein involved in chromosome partitioning
MMPLMNRDSIAGAVDAWVDPYLETSLGAAKAVQDLQVTADGRVSVSLKLGFPAARYGHELAAALGAAIRGIEGVSGVDVSVGWQVQTHAVQRGVKPMPEVRNIIAVASGKGGVGKSTVAANLALALASEGASVGVLDADIYGPSQPRMLGCPGRPEMGSDQKLEPKLSHGLQVMSIGNLVDEDTPMIWRGPMVTSALQQLLSETRWENLDYLVIDLPPGTGDIQLTLSQKVPVSGVVIVTTPQDIALLDARKGLKMFEQVGVPVLGIVENMSTHVCSRCGHEEPVFGSGGGARMAGEAAVPLLGQLPLEAQIGIDADGGAPTVVAAPDSLNARRFIEIGRRVAARLALRGRDLSGRFPNIVIQSS